MADHGGTSGTESKADSWQKRVKRHFVVQNKSKELNDNEGDPPNFITISQIGEDSFRLVSRVVYHPDGVPPGDAEPSSDQPRGAVEVELNRTDLTSVPQSLRWLIGQYGAHTPAVLLHDFEIERAAHQRDPSWEYEQADDRFLKALTQIGVPFMRRYLMWAAVSYGSLGRKPGRSFGANLASHLQMIAWFLSALMGTIALGVGVLRWAGQTLTDLAPDAGRPRFFGELLTKLGEAPGTLLFLKDFAVSDQSLVLVALFAPLLVVPITWGVRFRPTQAVSSRMMGAGLIASYALPFVAAPTLLGWAAWTAYSLLERVVALFDEQPRASPPRRT